MICSQASKSMECIKQKTMLPERNAYSADVPTNLEERHVEGGILDQFWMVLDGF